MTRLMNLNLASEMEVVEELRMTDMTKVSKKDVKKDETVIHQKPLQRSTCSQQCQISKVNRMVVEVARDCDVSKWEGNGDYREGQNVQRE